MKVLMVNKFLYPNGGSETYIFELGKQLEKMGHEVQYFGMEHEGRIVGNHAESYTANMDFHTGKLQKLMYPFKIIYSKEARKKIRVVLKDFLPDVVHLNNINFQITPSIIYEIRSFEKKIGKKIRIVFTAHDYQWICPNHMMNIPSSGENCEQCLVGKFKNCSKNKCIHNSKVKSVLGAIEGYYYRMRKTYGMVDTIICPSKFLFDKFAKDSILKDKLVWKHNFLLRPSNLQDMLKLEKKDYVLYFGRFSKEKGMNTLLDVCKAMPTIPFVFAGTGPMEEEVNQIPNVTNKGFQTGENLQKLIREARFSIYPSEWYENCPFSVMESQLYGTPVIGARIGGIPELIREKETGELFESGNAAELKEIIERLWAERKLSAQYEDNCKENVFQTVEEYCEDLLELYMKD